MKKLLLTLLFTIFCAGILAFSIRGISGNPTSNSLNQLSWKESGPFELSPERGRFALTYSLVEDKSASFSIPLAKFVIPDLGYINGKYVSLFAPGISFLIIPGYWLGRFFGISQVGTYAIISLFALANVLLIRAIANRLGASLLASTIASIIFIFATPAFSYAVSLYQHHVSTFLILLSIYILVRFRGLWPLLFIWGLCAASVLIDYPNLFLMFPIGLYALGRFVYVENEENRIKINLKLLGFLTFITALIPLSFFLLFNKISYGNPLQFSGTVPSVLAIDGDGKPTVPTQSGSENAEKFIDPQSQNKSAIRFFKTRNMLLGLNTHFLSPDRGIIFYTPVILFGILGTFVLYKKQRNFVVLLLSIACVDVVLYSMWGDPWGGWAFGSRYLIPSYAIMSIFVAFALCTWRKKTLFLILFFVIASYSSGVNTLGAVTTNRIPPKPEVLFLEKISNTEQKYTFMRNVTDLNQNKVKSFVFRMFYKEKISAWQYYRMIVTTLILTLAAMLSYYRFFSKEKIDD